MYDQLKAEYDEFVKGAWCPSPPSLCVLSASFAAQPREEITITLPDGAERKGTSWETSPMSIALEISKGLADKVVIAKVGQSPFPILVRLTNSRSG